MCGSSINTWDYYTPETVTTTTVTERVYDKDGNVTKETVTETVVKSTQRGYQGYEPRIGGPMITTATFDGVSIN